MAILARFDDPTPLGDAAAALGAVTCAALPKVCALRLFRLDGEWEYGDLTWPEDDTYDHVRVPDFAATMDDLTEQRFSQLGQRVIDALGEYDLPGQGDDGWAEVQLDFEDGVVDDLSDDT